MEDIEAELEMKSIERDTEVSDLDGDYAVDTDCGVVIEEAKDDVIIPPVANKEVIKKVKKPRSEKQIAAFEKARQKRAEQIALKKQTKIEQKEQSKLNTIARREEKLASKDDVVKPVLPVEKAVVQPVPQAPAATANVRENIVQNHYYYYNSPPPDHQFTDYKKKKKAHKRPPTPSSSEDESSDEEYIQPPPARPERPKPVYQFSYA